MLQLLPILWKSGSFYRFNKMIVLVKYQIFSAPAIPDMNARGEGREVIINKYSELMDNQ